VLFSDYHDNIKYNPLFSTLILYHPTPTPPQQSNASQESIHPTTLSTKFLSTNKDDHTRCLSVPNTVKENVAIVRACLPIHNKVSIHPSINKQTGKEKRKRRKTIFAVLCCVMHHKAHRSYHIRRKSAVIFQFSPSLILGRQGVVV
jgi:hypothetical protein